MVYTVNMYFDSNAPLFALPPNVSLSLSLSLSLCVSPSLSCHEIVAVAGNLSGRRDCQRTRNLTGPLPVQPTSASVRVRPPASPASRFPTGGGGGGGGGKVKQSRDVLHCTVIISICTICTY